MIHAEVETWKYVSNNQWPYVLQHPTALTILCGENKNHIKNIVLHKTGMLQLHNNYSTGPVLDQQPRNTLPSISRYYLRSKNVPRSRKSTTPL
ncbi:hypothetical protein ANTPLA_LOCUS8083 [Anthophora plagiata]